MQISDKKRSHSAVQQKPSRRAPQSMGLSSHWRVLAAAGIIVVAGLLAYHDSFGGPFIFDDVQSILENPHIRQLRPIWEVTRAEPGRTVARRPVLSISLALNYQISELKVWSYHATNLAIHILAALTLFGIVRRTLLSERLRGRFRQASFPLALVCAMIWLVHPLQTAAVTYVVQRAESLMGLFYLLSLYCLIRGAGGAKSRFWYVGAIVSCALGMGTKEVMATAPLVLLLYDRVFIARSFKEVFTRRWGLYAVLADTWVIILVSALNNPPLAFQTQPWHQYALTQCRVIIIYYLKLSFWPDPLVLDYGRSIGKSFGQTLACAIVLWALLAETVLAFRRRPCLGFLGAWFFLILGPTSSILPRPDVIFEHRMYLPLAALVVAVVLTGYVMGTTLLSRLVISDRRRSRLGRGFGYILAGGVIVVLGLLTVRRNDDYRSELSIWNDTIAKKPNNPRVYLNRGRSHSDMGNYDQALCDWNKAIELGPGYAEAHNNRGVLYISKGKYDLAIHDFEKAIELKPNYAKAYNNRGVLYTGKGDYDLAIRDFEKAIEYKPRYVNAHYNRGMAYLDKGNNDRAIRNFDRAIELESTYAKAYYNRGIASANKGDSDRAIRDFAKAIKLRPKSAEAYTNIVSALLQQKRFSDALQYCDQAMQLGCDHPGTLNNLAWVLATHQDAQVRNGAEATRLAERACQLTGYKVAGILDTLATAYAESGQFSKAVETAERAIKLAQSAQNEQLAKSISSRLAIYKANRAYREPFGL